MRVRSLHIRNLRAIERCDLSDLRDFVLIAGPNGCGKTTVLDALRLVKSIYVHDEWKRWFNEFGINPDSAGNWATVFRDSSKPIHVEAVFELSESERSFLIESASNIYLRLALNALADRRGGSGTVSGVPPVVPPTLSASALTQVRATAEAQSTALLSALRDASSFVAGISLTAEPALTVTESPIATAAFSCFNPEHLGEIEFHSSRRIYARESVDNVNIRLKSRDEERRTRFLYDLDNKYKNIKTQLTEEYLAIILRGDNPGTAPLQQSIKELFQVFFPGKEFLGVTVGANDALAFPVRLSTGETHDIDELSSGEKEIVYGYLWLRSGTPRRSVILVDEPELHLNPALVQGLPSFYQTHLSDALDAQVWIVTHSDAILRQAVRSSRMSVFHMSRATGDGTSQTRFIDGQDAVEAAVLDLIGDLAAYRPYARIVLVEGHRDTRFDVDMIRRLFPDIAERANLIPVGSRSMTNGVRTRLAEVIQAAGLTGRAVSISDGDLGLSTEPSSHHLTWPVYEIENFLLVPRVLRAALSMFLRREVYSSDEKVTASLKRLAGPLAAAMALVETQHALNREFVSKLSIGASANAALAGLVASTDAAKSRIAAVDASAERISAMLTTAETRFEQSLASNDFLAIIPGDRLLRAFAGQHGIDGDHFRNACLDVAQRLGLRPTGMEAILTSAVA